MQEPTFKPNTWVAYAQGGVGGFGEIIGGHFDGTDWHYLIKAVGRDGSSARILGTDIQFTYEGGNWMKPNYLSGNSSIYAQVEE